MSGKRTDLFYAKLHRTSEAAVLGACDAELLGRTLTCGGLVLYIDPAFFGDYPLSSEELVPMMMEADVLNLFGDRTVSLAVSLGYGGVSAAQEVCGTKHLQLLRS
ncbi:MAG: DUF424 domain-containing protein [Thermoprotei archaeon]|nr:DUF424 family protein [TACK group archaeon]